MKTIQQLLEEHGTLEDVPTVPGDTSHSEGPQCPWCMAVQTNQPELDLNAEERRALAIQTTCSSCHQKMEYFVQVTTSYWTKAIR